MRSIHRFLDHGTQDLRSAFERTPDIQRLLAGDYALADYRRLLERLRRGFAVVELYAFEDLPDDARAVLRTHRSTWRLSHDIGILGGIAPLPARPEDLRNAAALPTWSAKLGAHFALAHVLEVIGKAEKQLHASFGHTLVSCLLFLSGDDSRRFTCAVAQLIEQTNAALEWSEMMVGARTTLRTIRHGVLGRQEA